ncbi:FxSxx-COOH system tetratricopeptide repeat protein [Actinocorallia longicatena]|uniref:FxSxx-COOH system tetratricopeptide repeat protein n=1 Tax=Actinocorallia longicatena TaxID=111803 RepID=UPI0031DC7682
MPGSPGPEPRVWGSRIPLRNGNFTGRQEALRELRRQMSEGTTAILPQALRGMGGVGKTQLVIEYAHRFKGEYDVVWWVASDIPLLVPGALGAMAERLGLPSARSVGIDEACRSVLDALRRGDPYPRWLLIFDNANKPSDIEAHIPEPRAGQGHVLITSRNPEWSSVASTVVVDVFDRSESVEFLGKRVRDRITDAEAGQLAERLGDLPLALEQAGALQLQTGISSEEYLELLDQQPVETLSANQPTAYPSSMSSAWRLSITKLEEYLPPSLQLLRCMAFFGPEPIPIDLFRWSGRSAGPILSPTLSNPVLRTRAIGAIGNFALGKIDDRAIQIHRLVQMLLRADLDPKEQEEYQEEAMLLLTTGAPANPEDDELWGRFSRLVPHVVPVGAVESEDPRLRDFALNLVRYLYNIGDLGSARSFVTQFRDRWRELSGPDDFHVLSAERHLGNILRQSGRYQEAFDIDSSALERARRVLGADDELVHLLINSYGADYRSMGRFSEAQRHDEESRDLHVAKYGDTAPQTLRALNNLALDYALMSRYAEAVELQNFVVAARSTSSEAKVEVLISMGGLGQAVRLSGDYRSAFDLGVEAYEYGKAELGPDHFRTLRAGIDLAIVQRRLGTVEEALDLARDVHSRYLSLFGPAHADTVAAVTCLANALRTSGDVEGSHALADEVVRRLPVIFNPDHPFTLASRGNLALLERARGNVDLALAMNEEVLARLSDVLNRDHHYALTVAVNLANDLFELGRFEESAELDRDTLSRLKTLLGDDHPMTLGSAANLVSSLRSIGGNDEADALSQATLAAYDRILTNRHPDAVLAAEGGRLDFDFDPPRY